MTTQKKATRGACAACKYQRRRCPADCILAPYFPADKPKLFERVHRKYGVQTVINIIKNLDESQRDDAMKSITYECCVRYRSPVHGCLGLTLELKKWVEYLEKELHATVQEIQKHRSLRQENSQNHNPNQMMIPELAAVENTQQIMIPELGGDENNLNTIQNNVVPPICSTVPVTETQQPTVSNNGYCRSYNNAYWDDMNTFLHSYNNGEGCSYQNESCLEMLSYEGVTETQPQFGNRQMESNHRQREEDDEYSDVLNVSYDPGSSPAVLRQEGIDDERKIQSNK